LAILMVFWANAPLAPANIAQAAINLRVNRLFIWCFLGIINRLKDWVTGLKP
jgi:hypothetical protein